MEGGFGDGVGDGEVGDADAAARVGVGTEVGLDVEEEVVAGDDVVV